MELIEAIRSKRTIRGFKPDPVPREVLEELLETCRWAPSAQNTQSCEFAILGGKVMEEVRARIEEKEKTKAEITGDIPVPVLPEPYLQRANEQRDRVDRYQFPPGTENLEEKRAEYLLKGVRFHDAPNGIIIYTERALCPRANFDVGIMAQTISLAAYTYGLGTCIMVRVLYWPEVLRELLGIPESKLILLALAIGYPNPEARVNNYERYRLPLDALAHWHGV